VDYRRLGQSDLTISSIGLGCVTFGREIDREAAFAILDHALARGITLLDTAESYGAGASERVLGEWFKARGTRDKVVLATKVGRPLTAAAIETSLTASLQRLQTDRVDLFQFHAYDAENPLELSLAAMQAAIGRGQVRWPACSNYSGEELARVVVFQRGSGWPAMVSVQPMYNLVHREIEQSLLPACRILHVGAISYSPLGAGFLTGKYGRGEHVPPGTRFDVKPGHKRHYFTEAGFAALQKLTAASGRLGVPPPTLAIAWVMSRPDITSVLIGARNVEQIEQAIAAQKLAAEMGDRLEAELG
jgi:aryl-alcohol dehydrogenase-like predicted oxidoreductase